MTKKDWKILGKAFPGLQVFRDNKQKLPGHIAVSMTCDTI